MDHNELETFLILKYGSIRNMYEEYKTASDDFMTNEEKLVICNYLGCDHRSLEILRDNWQSAVLAGFVPKL